MTTGTGLTMPRRSFLQTAVAGGVLCLGSSGQAVAADDDAGWIDAHSHIWSTNLGKYPLADGQTVEDLQPREFTAEQLIAMGKSQGVQRFVLIQHKPYHGLDNSILLDAIAAHSGVFSAVACVEAAGAAPQDDMRRLAARGVRGFRIRPGEGGHDHWRDSPGMRAMWKCAAETGLAMCPLINPEYLSEVAEMCQQYREANVVIDHFARIGMDGEVREADLKSLCDLARFPQTNVKISAYYALGKKAPPYLDLIPMIQRLSEAYGPSRLMWATDSPYQLTPPNTYAASLELVRDHLSFLSEDDCNQVLRGTAQRVFFAPVRL
ncbi:MAG: amidohydrolase family protein [Planctomycetaceae bacterium]